MERRYEDILTCRMEDIFTKGAAFISWNELYLWYGVQKLAARTYRDLSERWDEVITQRGARKTDLGKLMFVQSAWRPSPGIFIFAEKMAQPVCDE